MQNGFEDEISLPDLINMQGYARLLATFLRRIGECEIARHMPNAKVNLKDEI